MARFANDGYHTREAAARGFVNWLTEDGAPSGALKVRIMYLGDSPGHPNKWTWFAEVWGNEKSDA